MCILKNFTNALQFEVHFSMLPPDTGVPFWGTGYSSSGFNVHFTRFITPIIIKVYIPSSILVVSSWVSFLIPPELVPGRMALLVTVLLMMLNLSINSGSPSKNKESDLEYLPECVIFNCIEVRALYNFNILKIVFELHFTADSA
jgi:hypothetical protein